MMARAKLADLSVNDLVELFAEIGVAQSKALDADDTAKYNRLFDKLMEVKDRAERSIGRSEEGAHDPVRLSEHASALKRGKGYACRGAASSSAGDRGDRRVNLAAAVLRRAHVSLDAR